MRKLIISVMLLFGVHTASALELKLTSHCDSLHTTIIKSHVNSVEYRLTYNSSSENLDIFPFINGMKAKEVPDNTLIKEEYETLCRVFERDTDGFWYDVFFNKENEQHLKAYLKEITNKYLIYFY